MTSSLAVALGSLTMMSLLTARPAAACLCDSTSSQELFASADVVFLGRSYAAIARDPSSEDPSTVGIWFSPAYKFSVLDYRKTQTELGKSKTLTVLDFASCRSIWSLGETSLVYAKIDANGLKLRTGRCAGTEPVVMSGDATNMRCPTTPTIQEMLDAADAVFFGRVLQGETDSKFDSGQYRFRVFITQSWKGAIPGQVVDVYEYSDGASSISVGGGELFHVKSANGRMNQQRCLNPLPARKRGEDWESYSRRVNRLQDELYGMATDKAMGSSGAPKSEYARMNVASGELTPEVFTETRPPQEAPRPAASSNALPPQSTRSNLKTAPYPRSAPGCARCSASNDATTRLHSLLAPLLALAMATTRRNQQPNRSRREPA